MATPYPNLECLRLDRNEITGQGAAGAGMTAFLQDQEKCKLKTLTLNDNAVESRLLTGIIRSNASLTDIEFSGNEITDSSMRMIAVHLLLPYCSCRLRAIKCNLIEIGLHTRELDLSGKATDPVVLLLLGAILRCSERLAVVRLASTTAVTAVTLPLHPQVQ